MAILYDYYKNPPQKGEEGKPLLHPRPVLNGTLETDYLAELISSRSTFSSADVKGMLDNLAFAILFGLSDSKNVHIDGLGTFSLSLESRFVENIKEIRSQSIRIKDIHFRPEKQLLKDLNREPIVRVKNPRKAISYTEEVRRKRILWYINRRQGINITTVMWLNSCNYNKAKADLEKMIQEGSIRKTYFGKSRVYVSSDK